MSRRNHSVDPETPALHSEVAEQCVLSAMMLDGDAIARVAKQLRGDAFHNGNHRALYDAILTLHGRDVTVDPLTLTDEMVRREQLDAIGGRNYLAYLIDVVPTAANVDHHVGIVKRHASRRALLQALERGRAELLRDADDPIEIARRLQAATLGVAVEDDTGGFRVVDTADIEALATAVYARGEATAAGKIPGLPTGFDAIDERTNGFRPGEFVIIAAVPKAWKSAFVDNVSINLARRDYIGGKVSAEMTREESLERMITAEAQVESARMSRGVLDEHEWRRFGEAGAVLRNRFHVDDQAFPELGDVIARCTELKSRVPVLSYLVVDYLQLVTKRMQGRRGDEEINEVCRAFKGLAKRLDVVMMAPAQCNYKEVEARADRRPEPRDIQGASGPAQTANFLFLLYNDSLYNPSAAKVLEVNCALSRRTPTFTANLQMYPQYQLLGPMNPARVRAA